MPSGNRTGSTVALTEAELWIQLGFFYVFLGGLVSTMLSVLIWVGVLREKKLRTRFYTIVGCLSFCRTFLCLQYLVVGLYRAFRTVSLMDPMQTRAVCHALHFWLYNASTIELLLLLFLVIDGYVSVVESLYYRQWRARSAFHICVGIFVLTSIFKLAFSYSMVDLSEEVQCVNLYSGPSDLFNEFSQDLDITLVGLMLAMYLALIIHLRCKAARIRQRAGAEVNDPASRAMQRQLMLLPVIRNQVLMHCSFALTSKLLLTLAVVVPASEAVRQRLTALGGIFTCLDVFADVTTLLFGNQTLRATSMPCLRWKHGTRLQATPSAQIQAKRKNETPTTVSRQQIIDA